MRRYQTESQRASGASSGSASTWVSDGSSNLAAFSRASPPVAGPKERAAKIATRSTAARVDIATRQAARNASESRAAAIAPTRVGVASYAMPDVDLYTAATKRLDLRGDRAVGRVRDRQLVDRAIAKRGARVGELVARGELSPAAQTRLRLVRRLISVADRPDRRRDRGAPSSRRRAVVATGILASSAVLGLVVGFAARQTLANGIAGILLAITQPIRIGDLVTFEEETGVVEDVKLTYTYIRLDDGRRLIVPNERLAQSSVAEPHDRRPASAGGGVGVAAARRRPRQGDGADPRTRTRAST